MTKSEVAYGWIHLTGDALVMGSIIVLVHKGIMVIIAIILLGVRGDTCQMSSRNPSLLHLMESLRN